MITLHHPHHHWFRHRSPRQTREDIRLLERDIQGTGISEKEK
jgi:hypothetical protein